MFSEAADLTGSPIKLEAGQEHDFKIIKMNQDEKKVGLSLRAVVKKQAEPMWKPTSSRYRARPPRSGIWSTGSVSNTNKAEISKQTKGRRNIGALRYLP